VRVTVRQIMGIAVCTAGVLLASRSAAGRVSADDVRGLAARWLAGYDQALAAVVATETYVQEVRRKEAHDTAESVTSRIVTSEFAWVPVLGGRDVLGVRAVRSIDGRVVGDAGRLEALLNVEAPDREAQVQALLAESVRHLEVPGAVNFNFPTFTLAYLRPENAGRAKWSVRDGPDADTADLRFRERERTLVRTREGQRVRAEGSLIVERATGRVRESRLALTDVHLVNASSTESVRYEAIVRYTQEPRLGIAVPSEMDDRYEWRLRNSGNRGDVAHVAIDGHATYTDFRRFQTDARIVPQ
jgi:hypothetical protein